MRLNVFTALIGVVAGLMAMTAHAALVTTAGGLGVYDNVNNVTWTSDANLMATQAAAFGGGSVAYVNAVIAASGGVIVNTPNAYSPSGTYTLSVGDFNTSTGTMTWFGAKAWANYLNSTNYAGSNQWALPTTVDNNASAGNPNGGAGNPAQSSSQLAQLFYGGLGQLAGSPITLTNNGSGGYALFNNVQSNLYWSGTEYSASPTNAWFFTTVNGLQRIGNSNALADRTLPRRRRCAACSTASRGEPLAESNRSQPLHGDRASPLPLMDG